MMPAAKHGDPQLGIDIHLCITPATVPLPTPHLSIVFDPFDYIPIIGATVTVCGMKRATAGTNGLVVHIPPGFPFAPKLPDKDDELFMGSSTVIADGDPLSHIAHPVLGCQIAGMMSPPRLKKKNKKMMLLPTTFNLAIPTNVFVGGPPTISMLGMAFKAGFSALGRFARSGLFKRIRQRVFKKLKPGFLKCVILRAEPVNILTGEVSVEQSDFTLPGRIPVEWTRTYSSGTKRQGCCGYAWETPADTRLEADPSNGSVTMIHPSIGPLFFDRLPAQGEEAELELMDGALLTVHEGEFQVRTKEDRIYRFRKNLSQVNDEGATEYPIWRIHDLCGNWLEFERSGGKLVGIRESAGRRIMITADGDRITEVALCLQDTEERHVFVRYEYDLAGDLVTVRDAQNNPYTFAYDSHHMVRHTDRNGLSFYYEYETTAGRDRRVVHSWGDGGLYDYRFEYIDLLNERRITDSLNHVSIVKLDERGLPISEIDPLGGITTYEYDDSGRTIGVTDQDGHRTGYDYDERGNVLKLTRPDGKFIEAGFDDCNKAVIVTEPNGAEWRQKWDVRGLVLEQTSPLGNVSRYEYDVHGQLVAFINPRGAHWRLAYDSVGNLTGIIDALGSHRTFIHDPFGQVTKAVDPLGFRTAYEYDPKGRLVGVEFPSGATIRFGYDAEDNPTRHVDGNAAETRLEYFGQGKIAKHIQPDGYNVEYHYDTEEQLIGVTNQLGETYRFVLDPLGRINEEIDYWGQSKKYSYSPCGHIRQIADPLGRSVRYRTDPLGRIVKRDLLDPDSNEPFEESFEYDANCNLTVSENPHIRIERDFDAEGLMIEERQGSGVIVRNVYDEAGNRIQRQTALKHGATNASHSITYSYDMLNQVAAVSLDDHPPVMIERDSAGNIISEQLSPELKREIAYHPDGYITGQRVRGSAKGNIETAYLYDPAGNLIERQDAEFGIDRFVYDPVGRITEHLDSHGKLQRYFYDPAGNRLRTITARTESQLRDAKWFREAELKGAVYRFDLAGNLVYRNDERGELTLRWDANQRMVASRLNNQSTVYQYDPLGRRIRKQTGLQDTIFYWDGDVLAGEIILGGDAGQGSIREYVHYPASFVPLALVENKGINDRVRFYHNEPNGCPSRLTDMYGNTVWSAHLGVSGEAKTYHEEIVANPIRMQGQYEDPETGLHYNRYRYYDPVSGGFVSQDPAGLFAGSNLYQYAPNVMGWIDPWGLKPCNIKPKTIEALQAAKPSNMINPHMHHIVMEGAFSGWTKENRKLITQARSILRKHGIDIQGSKNVVWAENAGHSVEYAKKVLNELKQADTIGKQAVIDKLQEIGKKLSAGNF